jgi:hypothetical protein
LTGRVNEIEQSEAGGNCLLGIDVTKITDFNGDTTDCCGKIPADYPFSL